MSIVSGGSTNTPDPPIRIAGMSIAKLVLLVVAGLVLLILLAKGCQGLYQVRPGEAAALQTFGKAKEEPVKQEGLHWHWPGPVGKTTVIQVEKSRTAAMGWQVLPDGKIDAITGENWQRDLLAATMITGDLNLLETQLVAHYYISDLNSYLFRADDPGIRFEYIDGESRKNHQSHEQGFPDGQTLVDVLEIAVRRAVGQRTIDQALVSDREVIERETMEHSQDILNMYRTGLTITSVQLQEVKPPDEVQAAFDDVLQAREEKEKRINEALAFESRTLPEARGEAERIRREADAYSAERVNQATGEADRFLSILEEYQAAPEIIAERMYLETMDIVLPRTNQIILAGVDAGPIIINGAGQGSVIPVNSP